jgi:hypothetical protein
MDDEYPAYKVHHIANLISIKKREKILMGYLSVKKKNWLLIKK